MSIDLFKRIIEKAKGEGYNLVGIYNWTEPFLAKELPKYISIVKEFGLCCEVSSNLSLNPLKYFNIIEQSLMAGLDRLVVSVSGYRQTVYEINHVGGNISWVRENLEHISQFKRKGIISTRVFLRFLKFDYNIEEEPLLKNYMASLGLDFEVLVGVGRPDNPVSLFASEEHFLDRLKKSNYSKTYEIKEEICPLIMDTVSIDIEGNAYICCAYPNYLSLRIGAYLEVPENDLLLRRYTHPICITCAFPRRKTTESDCKSLSKAMKSRVDNPIDSEVIDNPTKLFHRLRKICLRLASLKT
jgi:hypothetical protein